MGLFDITYATKAIEWLPVDKRNPALTGFVQALFTPVQWLRDKFLGDYRTGTTNTTPFNIINTQTGSPGYAAGAVVKYKQVVYVSLINANHDYPPSPNWQQYLPSFLGVNERVNFNGTKLVLEFALNQYYQVNFRQPGLLGYYYPSNTPGTPNTAQTGYSTHSDIFILNNAYQLVGFNVGTRDFIPAPWQAGVSYTANLSKVMEAGIEYLCTTTNTDTVFNSAHWHSLGAPPAHYVITAGIVTGDISDNTDYPLWDNQNYTQNQAVVYEDFVYVCIQSTTVAQAPGDQDYWFKIDGIGYNNAFLLGDHFTIYFPTAVYAQTNDSEINNFVNQLAYAGTQHTIATY